MAESGERGRESLCCCLGKLEPKMRELKVFLTAAPLAYASHVFQPWTAAFMPGKLPEEQRVLMSWL